MATRSSLKDYRNHNYSGPRKNRKRSQGQIKRYYGVTITSRTELYRKKTDNINVPSTSTSNNGPPGLNTKVRQYTNKKKIYQMNNDVLPKINYEVVVDSK